MIPLGVLAQRQAATGGAPLAATYLGNYSTGDDASTFTATAASLGPASPDRHIIVVLSWVGTPGFTPAITLGGSAMTTDVIKISSSTIDPAVAISRLAVPSGTSADIVATFAAGPAALRATIGWFAVTGATSITPTSPVHAADTVSVTVPENGVAIIGAQFGVVGTWSGFTPDYTAVQESSWRGVGGRLSTSGTVSNSSTTYPYIAAVAYQGA